MKHELDSGMSEAVFILLIKRAAMKWEHCLSFGCHGAQLPF